ncbi:MAG: hypothetical protein J6336_03390 [Kiritimatiellae bacterium]|nr:hypothetical protein [Kiritimatiellia bacterium]
MREIWIRLLVAGVATVAAGDRLTVGELPEPAYPDREVSAVFPLPEWGERNVRMTLSAAPRTETRVGAALGTDADGDGALDDDETAVELGWDRGVWFILGGEEPGECLTAPPSRAGGPMVMEIRLSPDGAIERIIFRDTGGALDFGTVPSAWLVPSAWNAVRLTARGPGGRGERFEYAVFPDGLTLILN